MRRPYGQAPPPVVDTDGDGWSDRDERDCDTDPFDPASQPPDPDGDGACNPWEGEPPANAWYGLGASEPAPWAVYAASSTTGAGITAAPGEVVAGPSVAVDSTGAVYLAWTHLRPIQLAGGMTGRPAAYLRRHADQLWQSLAGSAGPGGLSGIEENCVSSRVAIGPANDPVVAWVCTRPGEHTIHVRRNRFGQWEELAGFADEVGAVRVGARAGPGYEADFQLAVDSTERIWVAWVETDTHVYASRYEADGWQEVASSASGPGVGAEAGFRARELALVLLDDDAPVLGWVSYDTPSSAVYSLARLRDDVWEVLPAPTAADASNVSDRPIALAGRGAGGLVAAWRDMAVDHDGLHVAIWDGASWTPILASTTGDGLGPSPRQIVLAVDDSSDPLVGWVEDESGAPHVHRPTLSGWVDLTATGWLIDRPVQTALLGLALLPDGSPVLVWSDPTWSVQTFYAAARDQSGWRSMGETRSGMGMGSGLLHDATLTRGAGDRLSLTWVEHARLPNPGDGRLKHRTWTPDAWTALPGSLDPGGLISATYLWTDVAAFVSDGLTSILFRDPTGRVRFDHDGTQWRSAQIAETRGWAAEFDRHGRVLTAFAEGGQVKAVRLEGSSVEDLGVVSAGATLPTTQSQIKEIRIAVGGDGQAVVAWIVCVDPAQLFGGDLLVARHSPAGWQGLDGSTTFPGLSDGSQSVVHPHLAIDEVGEPTAVWVHAPIFDMWGGSEIRLSRHRPEGWVELDGSAHSGGLSRTAGGAFGPAVALDGNGDPVVAWADSSTGPFQVYLRHWFHGRWMEHWGSATGGGVSNSAASSWPSDLVVDPHRICVAYGDSEDPTPLMVRCSDL